MNINDFRSPTTRPGTFDAIWEEIFKKQMSLAKKYMKIEDMGNLFETLDTNVDTAKGQRWIKDFAWRVTEELAEAFEALETEVDPEDKDYDKIIIDCVEHYKEELADALHFLVELTIIAGHNYEILINLKEKKYELKHTTAWPTIYNLGLMCNTLKNKPWKQTQMLTDRVMFEKYLITTWQVFIMLLTFSMGTKEDIYDYYFKKNEVNQFRQRSKY